MFDPIVRSFCSSKNAILVAKIRVHVDLHSCNSLYKQETDRQFRPVSFSVVRTRYHSRVFDYLAHPNLSAALATDQKWPFAFVSLTKV